MHMHRLLAALVLVLPSAASAAPVWVGDLETGDLSQWSGVLNGDINGMAYASVSGEEVVQGQWAARIELHNDAVWPNGLKRVELNHSPADGRTAEGAVLFFAWSFYLPTTLPAEPTQQIGYWESADSYKQMMAFEISGERMSFSTRQPNNVIHWDEDGVATAGVWHRLAMRILWSKDPAIGTVDVWLDGEQVVTAAPAKTLNDDNPHFTQVGLLRGQVDFDDVAVILIDDAVEGDNLEDVTPDPVPPGGTTTDASTTTTVDTSSSEPPIESTSGDSTGAPHPTGDHEPTTGAEAPETTTTTTGTTTTPAPTQDDDKGCGCATGSPGALAALASLLRRRRRR